MHNSTYLYNNRKKYKYIEKIDLLNDDDAKLIKITDKTIHEFISCCQNEQFNITLSNVFHLQYLSYKYEVQQLTEITTQFISTNLEKLVFDSILFKTIFQIKNS